jgi:hypothetical protein
MEKLMGKEFAGETEIRIKNLRNNTLCTINPTGFVLGLNTSHSDEKLANRLNG